jgi:hypothetical protein
LIPTTGKDFHPGTDWDVLVHEIQARQTVFILGLEEGFEHLDKDLDKNPRER